MSTKWSCRCEGAAAKIIVCNTFCFVPGRPEQKMPVCLRVALSPPVIYLPSLPSAKRHRVVVLELLVHPSAVCMRRHGRVCSNILSAIPRETRNRNRPTVFLASHIAALNEFHKRRAREWEWGPGTHWQYQAI